MQRCPCCNARLKEAVTCPRCKAELQDIIQVQRIAKFWYRKAVVYYLHNNLQCCVNALTQSLQLQHTDSAFVFRDFAMQQQNQTLWVKLQSNITVAQSQIASLVTTAASSLENLILKSKQYNLWKGNQVGTRLWQRITASTVQPEDTKKFQS